MENDLRSSHQAMLLIGLMLACSFLWAGVFLLMKHLGPLISPLALTAARGTMGGAFLAFWLVLRGQPIMPRGREWRDWAVLGVLQGIIPNTLTAFAVLHLSVGLTSIIQATTPLIVTLGAQVLFAEERLGRTRLAGLVLGFAGMAILIGPITTGGGDAQLPAALAMCATACSYAFGALYIRAIPKPQPLRLAFGQQVFSGLPALAFVLLTVGPGAFAGMGEAPLLFLLLGTAGTAVPIVLFMHILHRAGPTVGSMNGYLLPPWTMLLGFAILGETPLPREIIGAVIVLLGVAIVTRFLPLRRRPAL